MTFWFLSWFEGPCRDLRVAYLVWPRNSAVFFFLGVLENMWLQSQFAGCLQLRSCNMHGRAVACMATAR